MSVQIYDEKGYVGDLATNTGYEALAQHLSSVESSEIQYFLEEGVEDVDALKEELALVPEPSDSNIAATLANLRDLVSKCKGLVIVSDGT